jgi:N-acetylmuramic acid 6-phosphate etherase
MANSSEFLSISSQFQLGSLVTEQSHPVTANLSELPCDQAIAKLFEADADVWARIRLEVRVNYQRIFDVADQIASTVNRGGNIIFTGCGSTGRLSILLESIWRDYWMSHESLSHLQHRALSAMAGGDFALIKSVEGELFSFLRFGIDLDFQDLKISPVLVNNNLMI